MAIYGTYFLLLLYLNFNVFSKLAANDKYMKLFKNLLVSRFQDSITTYHASINGILLSNNNKSDESFTSKTFTSKVDVCQTVD